jgi:predicted TIM-barrel fold metal-dependent hydrolase
MVATQESEAAKIRRTVRHPIIDADGHMLEVTPVFNDYLTQVGGSQMLEKLDRYINGPGESLLDHICTAGWAQMTPEERKLTGTAAGFWWFRPTANSRYRATASLPKLFYDRLDELGLDFSVLFGTLAVGLIALPGIPDEELRRACCRAFNMYISDLYGEFADRITPAAAIPAHTPQEALDELDFAIAQRGLKATLFPSYIVRIIERDESNKHLGDRLAPFWLDFFAIDSDYDYDPVWQRCLELGVAPCFHSTANGITWGPRNSPSNLMYNTVGNFAESGDAIAKALFMGGVTRRFPKLRFGFLEGGAGRGTLLYSGMLGFWEKRHEKALRKNTDPRAIDLERLGKLVDEYGHERVKEKKEEFLEQFRMEAAAPEPDIPNLDDWHKAQIERPEQFKDLFQDNLFFGCEADDPTVVHAFNTKANPFGAKIRTFMGSDISHCDVIEPLEVVPEAYELVEHGLLTPEEWTEFAYKNAVLLYGGMNPDFFKGSPAEAAAKQVLAENQSFRTR